MRKKNIFCIFFASYTLFSIRHFFFSSVLWRPMVTVTFSCFDERFYIVINKLSFIHFKIHFETIWFWWSKRKWMTHVKKKKEIEFENIEFGACTSHFFSFPPYWMEPFLRWAFQLQFETRIFFFFFKSKHRAMDHFCRCWGHS